MELRVRNIWIIAAVVAFVVFILLESVFCCANKAFLEDAVSAVTQQHSQNTGIVSDNKASDARPVFVDEKQEIEEGISKRELDKTPLTQFNALITLVLTAVGSFLIEAQVKKHRGIACYGKRSLYTLVIVRILSLLLASLCVLFAILNDSIYLYHIWFFNVACLTLQFTILCLGPFVQVSDEASRKLLKFRDPKILVCEDEGKRYDVQRSQVALQKWMAAIRKTQLSSPSAKEKTADDYIFTLQAIIVPISFDELDATSYDEEDQYSIIWSFIPYQRKLFYEFVDQLPENQSEHLLSICAQTLERIRLEERNHGNKLFVDSEAVLLSVLVLTHPKWDTVSIESHKGEVVQFLQTAQRFTFTYSFAHLFLQSFAKFLSRVDRDRRYSLAREFGEYYKTSYSFSGHCFMDHPIVEMIQYICEMESE